MDALGIFELSAKAGRAYVRAIRQAYRDVIHADDLLADGYEKLAADPEYQAEMLAARRRERLVEREAEQEVSEPRMERDGPDAAKPVGGAFAFGYNEALPLPNVDGYGPCECVCDLCTLGMHCDTASCATLPDWEADLLREASQCEALLKGCRCVVRASETHVNGWHVCKHGAGFSPGAADFPVPADAAPPVPSSSAGRGVGSPGVSAGAEEQAPSGGRPTPGEFAAVAVREVLAEHHPWEGAGGIECSPESADFEHPYSVDHLLHFADKYDWREHVATEVQRRIDAAVGATPTPKPAEAEAASTFEQHKKAQK